MSKIDAVRYSLSPALTAGVSVGLLTLSVTVISLFSNGKRLVKFHLTIPSATWFAV
ncbi:MAG: hypothetical protein IPN86_19920 [Saprospiraceae bacterium]|nr:hypothetical protein [Saprospiraceae bacterium]